MDPAILCLYKGHAYGSINCLEDKVTVVFVILAAIRIVQCPHCKLLAVPLLWGAPFYHSPAKMT